MTLTDTDLPGFQQHFEAGLAAMLAPHELGAFILVLANSTQSAALRDGLATPLAQIFANLQPVAAQGLAHGGPDDIAVFAQLRRTGIDAFGVWQQRDLGPWRCAYNPLRGLKPERASNDPFHGLDQPFDADRFHFDKPFLRAEILAEESHAGTPLRIMYHKFPFAPWHLMLLIDAAAHRPQYLTQADHELIYELGATLHPQLPGFGIGYNSIGAGASINHLHLHSFIDTQPLAVELPRWSHNGGDEDYPVTCVAFDNPADGWQAIAERHAANQPYNLLYRGTSTYLLTRPPQADIDAPPWLSNVTWYEVCGRFNLVDKTLFDTLSAADIDALLSSL